jgi:hypothetical protein
MNVARPIVVGADIVTDCMAIAQVWPSWVAFVMLGVVYIPNLVTATVMAGSMWVCSPSKNFSSAEQQADGTVDVQQCYATDPMKGPSAEANTAQGCDAGISKVQVWVAKPLLILEMFTLRMYGLHGSLIWRACCTLVMWPVHLVAGIPMLLLYSGVCKSILADADQGFTFFHPEIERVHLV